MVLLQSKRFNNSSKFIQKKEMDRGITGGGPRCSRHSVNSTWVILLASGIVQFPLSEESGEFEAA